MAGLEQEIASYIDAIGQGLLSAALRTKLEASEAERERLIAAAAKLTPEAIRMLPDAVARYRAMVADLPAVLAWDPERARELIRRLVGSVRLVRDGDRLYAELEVNPGRLLDLTGNTMPEGSHGVVGSGGRI